MNGKDGRCRSRATVGLLALSTARVTAGMVSAVGSGGERRQQLDGDRGRR